MKFYLAARYSRHPEMRRYREDLEALGHTVTSRWVNGEHQMLNDSADEGQARRFAEEDWDDLVKADCLICFTEAPRSTNSRGGRHVEFGLALGMGLAVIVVGPRENVFHYLEGVDAYETWEDLIRVWKNDRSPHHHHHSRGSSPGRGSSMGDGRVRPMGATGP